jgi:hypothetical protein
MVTRFEGAYRMHGHQNTPTKDLPIADSLVRVTSEGIMYGTFTRPTLTGDVKLTVPFIGLVLNYGTSLGIVEHHNPETSNIGTAWYVESRTSKGNSLEGSYLGRHMTTVGPVRLLEQFYLRDAQGNWSHDPAKLEQFSRRGMLFLGFGGLRDRVMMAPENFSGPIEIALERMS